MEGEEEVHTMSKNFLILPQMEEYKDTHQRFLCRITLMRQEVGGVEPGEWYLISGSPSWAATQTSLSNCPC